MPQNINTNISIGLMRLAFALEQGMWHSLLYLTRNPHTSLHWYNLLLFNQSL